VTGMSLLKVYLVPPTRAISLGLDRPDRGIIA
jgi:hypothetical protein